MEITIEQLLQLYGESQVKVRIMEDELSRLLQENKELKKGEGKSPLPLEKVEL